MDRSMTAFEKRKVFRSLVCLAHCVIGRTTTVDLRNESSLTGKIVNVDAYMNVTIEDAAFVEYEGSYKYFAQCHIPGRMIRDILIPEDIEINGAIKNLFFPKREPKVVSKKRTFKMKRSMLQQQESLRMMSDLLKQKTAKQS